MKSIRKITVISIILSIFSGGCGEIVTYPDTPIVDYKDFSLFKTTDDLGNPIFLGVLETNFTDGDGDIGISELELPEYTDSLQFNFFTTLYFMNNGSFEKADSTLAEQNFTIPDIARKGQNKTLKGLIKVEFEYYEPIRYDTIFYTFYLMDQQHHKSNIDSSEIIIFTASDF